MDQDAIQAIILTAIAQLYDEDSDAIEYDVNERTLSSRIAWLIAPSFPEHRVHAEYNKHGLDPKGIELPDAGGNPTFKRVYPDIIVHIPGTDDQNLLIVEIKKSTNQMDDDQDLLKLDRMRHQLSYTHALFIRLPTGAGASADDAYLIWR